MISVIKNFFEKPPILSSPEVINYLSELGESYNDGKKDVIDFLPKNSHKIYNNAIVKSTLNHIYFDKCAFCEQYATLEIEHYRPKSKYVWLLFEWSNLIPVCHECNVNKMDRFSIKGKEINFEKLVFANNILLANSNLLKSEQPFLLHPEIDSPENHIYFDSEGVAIGRTDRGRYTIDSCNLNRRILLKKRLNAIKGLKEEILELSTNFFEGFLKVRGHHFVENIPKEIERFFTAILNKGNADKEFSRLHQCIWDQDVLFDVLFNEDSDRNIYIEKQFRIWKNLFSLHSFSKKRIESISEKIKHPSIYSFQLQNVDGIRHLSIDGLTPSAQWIFLTGENGYGKSSILKAIASGLVGENVNNDESRSKIELICNVNDYTGQKHTVVNQYVWQNDSFKPYENLAAYGANRTTMSNGYDHTSTVLDSIYGRNVELLNIEKYLINIYHRDRLKLKFDSIINTLRTVIPQLADIKVDDTNEIPEVKYFEYIDDEKSTFEEVNFNQLATGIRSIVAMIGDILCRFLVNKEIVSSEDIEGIVIIDELDIHLHPKWQKLLPTLLSKAFPKVQFIASTHSPIPLLGAPNHSIFLKVSRNLTWGVQIDRLEEIEHNIKNMLPNLIYTSELFDLGSISSISNKSKNQIMTQDNMEDALEFKELKRKFKFKEIKDQDFLDRIKKNSLE